MAGDRWRTLGVAFKKGSRSQRSRFFQQQMVIRFLLYMEDRSCVVAAVGDSLAGHRPYSQRVLKPPGKKGWCTNDCPPGLCVEERQRLGEPWLRGGAGGLEPRLLPAQ